MRLWIAGKLLKVAFALMGEDTAREVVHLLDRAVDMELL